MADIFVEYQATISGTDSVSRVFVKVPKLAIAEYRKTKGDKASDDIELALELSQPQALMRPYLLQLREYSLDVYCSDSLPAELLDVRPASEQGGLTFWEA
jgi:hypothetical protein